MAETTEQTVQPSSIQHHEVISSDMDTTKDPELASSKSMSEGPVGMEKPNVPHGEVMSLKECCKEAFDKITEYLKGELDGRYNKSCCIRYFCLFYTMQNITSNLECLAAEIIHL